MKIMLAIDDSKFCAAAANQMLARVKANGTEVKLLCVLDSFPATLAEKMGSKGLS